PSVCARRAGEDRTVHWMSTSAKRPRTVPVSTEAHASTQMAPSIASVLWASLGTSVRRTSTSASVIPVRMMAPALTRLESTAVFVCQ
ncbi:unnamed protein product, partial [Candidula unifasciata]